eukprot:364126-Chlamydomonas_euryale.AAC.2
MATHLQDVEITASDGVKLHGWFLHLPHWTSEYMKTRPVVLFFQAGHHSVCRRLAASMVASSWDVAPIEPCSARFARLLLSRLAGHALPACC